MKDAELSQSVESLLLHLAPAGFDRGVDPETIEIQIGPECVGRVRLAVLGVNTRRNVNVTVALTYPRIVKVYDRLWKVDRSPGDEYFPLACKLSELDATVATSGFPVTNPQTYSILAEKIIHVLSAYMRPLSGPHEAKLLLQSDRDSPWFSRLAYENFLPTLVLIEDGVDKAVDLAQSILENYSPESERFRAYERFVQQLRGARLH
jgi:hypothetical protein